MKTYAWICDDIVAELKQLDDDVCAEFHPAFTWVQVPEGVMPARGWSAVESGTEWTFTPPSDPVLSKPEVQALIAEQRYVQEAAGVIVNELQIDTSRDSQSLIASTGLSAILDPSYRCNFKTLNGFVEIDAGQILAIAKAVRAHVQACFDRELELLQAVEASTYSDVMLNEGWPDPAPV